MTSSLKHMIFLAVALAVLGGLYIMLSQSGFFERGIQTTADVEARTTQLEQDIFADFDRISAITLDEGVLSSPTFQSLVDTPLVISPRPVSRNNPFEHY